MESKTQQSDLDLPGNFDYNSEWPMYDDGPVSIDDVPDYYKNWNRVDYFTLKRMIERWPAMRKSWENFIIDYYTCLGTLESEEADDDIPF